MPFWPYFLWILDSFKHGALGMDLLLGPSAKLISNWKESGSFRPNRRYMCFSADFRQFHAEQNVPLCLIFFYLGQFSSLRKQLYQNDRPSMAKRMNLKFRHMYSCLRRYRAKTYVSTGIIFCLKKNQFWEAS